MILSIETTTAACSVALHHNGNLLASQDVFGDQTHASMLTVQIDSLLQQTRSTPSQLTAIALSDGPGSYTGLRIGSSTAKGLCLALDIPLVAVSTLEAMALQVATLVKNLPTSSKQVLLCPMIDARRLEVYTALYTLDLEVVSPIAPLIITENAFEQYTENATIYYFGDGAAKCKTILPQPNFSYMEGIFPSARTLGTLAYLRPNVVDIAYYESLYLKEYQGKIASKKL